MKRSQLKIIVNKTDEDIDLYKFRKQRNLVINPNQEKKKLPNLLSIENNSKPFLGIFKHYTLKGEMKTSGNITLSGKEDPILKKIEALRLFIQIHYIA